MSTTSKPHAVLTLAQADKADDLSHKIRAIVACIRVASERAQDLPDAAIPGACWAVEDMVKELCALVTGEPAGSAP